MNERFKYSTVRFPEPIVPEDFRGLYAFAQDLKQRADALMRTIERNCPVLVMKLHCNDIAKIQFLVASYFHQDVLIMRTSKRPQAFVWPRQVAMFFCREFMEGSLSEIGLHFGGRDHGTVVYAIAAVKARCDVDAACADQVKYLRERIQEVLSQAKMEEQT